MNRLDHHSQRLNDVLFAVVLAAAAACTGWIAAAQAEPATAPAVAHAVELERVVVVGQREAAPLAAAPTIVLPPVVITGKRIDESVARAASRANNS